MKTTLRYIRNPLGLIFYLCCLSQFALAQPKQGQERIDSLLSLLPNGKEDTIKAIWLSEISTEYNIIDPNKGLQFGTEALELSQRLNWTRGEMMSHLSIGLNYNQKNDYPKALEHMLKSVRIAEQRGDVYNAASTNVSLGVVYLRAKDTTKALASYNDALKSFEKLKDARGLAFVYNNLANIYDDRKERDKAVEHYTKALDLFEKGNNRYGVAMVNVNIGTVYQAQKDYTKALSYFFKSLNEYRQLGATRGIAINLNNIGETYMNIAADSSSVASPDSLRDRKVVLQKAESYSLKGFELGKEIESFDVMFNTANHLSTIKELQGDPT
ncbi:MAG TPA: tetratricopeptide repeat protein, partial [Chitinophagales bacterium]|nr:tetratricopeptide repeat protein [Chitinophagales bacterium]